MEYTFPSDVRTPKKNVKGVHVLYDGAKDSFAIAVLKWADNATGQVTEKLALRWNGSDESPKGFPTAKGHPSWFIVPDKLVEILRAKAEELNEVEGKAKIVNLSNKIIEHVSNIKVSEQGTLGFTTYTTSEKLTQDELINLEGILKKNLIFFLKTNNPNDTFETNLNGDLTIRLNFLNDYL
ncbi:hypothetical protein [Acinetobacter baumannii]|uniref:hypothetical protein n=1 Tax=Acinetobacter baumannii TaxID=470 RepID=UPI0022A03DC0|nr:hypothetical protein [Acinetobacter baumannii]MDV7555909.1 hypothetical protein [Acinetobacter baumannii]HCU0566570.1 hypothetical protein [Acinetobacter baumannii]